MTRIIHRRRGHVSGRKPVAPADRKPAPPVLRRPLTEKCYALLDMLRREGYSAEIRRGWEALWREWRDAAPEEAANTHAAGLVCYTGWTVAMAANDPRAAVGYMDAFFRNPFLDAADRLTRVSYRCNLAFSLFCAGEEAESLLLYRQLLAVRHRDSARLALATARSQLFGYCREQFGADTAPEGLAALVRDIAARLRRKRQANRIEPGAARYALLAEVLEATYPAREEKNTDDITRSAPVTKKTTGGLKLPHRNRIAGLG
jgi:hypothetical protein